jgi:hypothetical protein
LVKGQQKETIKMSEYQKLREKYDKLFNKELVILQSNCKHDPTGWTGNYNFHFGDTGELTKRCKICGKELARCKGSMDIQNGKAVPIFSSEDE